MTWPLLIWWSKALDVDNSGHIDKELLTQVFTEEGEAFSEVEKFLLTRKFVPPNFFCIMRPLFSSQEEMQEFCNAALDPVSKSVHYKEFVHFLSVDDNF